MNNPLLNGGPLKFITYSFSGLGYVYTVPPNVNLFFFFDSSFLFLI